MRLLPFLAAFALFLSSCSRPDGSIRDGSRVRVHYTLSVDGRQRETSLAGEPLAYVAGSRDVIAGLDEALRGARAGEEKTVVIPPEKAYGAVRADKLDTVPLESLAGMGRIAPGVLIHGMRDGGAASAKVREVSGGKAVLDFNHELAGKTLTFAVRVVSVD